MIYDIKDLGRDDPGPAIYPALNKGGAELKTRNNRVFILHVAPKSVRNEDLTPLFL